MQLIASSHPGRAPRGPVIASTFVGGFLLFGGLVLTWLALATPFVGAVTPTVVRPTIDQMAVGAVIWAVALIAPPSFAIVGAIRLWLVATAVLRKPGATPVGRQLASLGDDCVVAPVAMLPDGRRVRNLVVTAQPGRCAAPTAAGSRSKLRSIGRPGTPSASGAGLRPRSATSS